MESALSDLEQSILRTAAWFSLSQYPLTHFELWKWLLLPERAYSLAEVEAELRESPSLRESLTFQDGWVALASAGDIGEAVGKRHARFLDATRKLGKLKRAARWLGALGSVRAVAACNTLGWYATDKDSDIDLFILVRPGTVWTARLLLVAPFLLLGKRPIVHEAPEGPAASSAGDPYCFSFFLSSAALRLDSLPLPGGDPYFAYWMRSLIPVFDRDGLFDRLREANGWVRAYLPHANGRPVHSERAPSGSVPALAPSPRLFESLARLLQAKRFPKALRDLMNRDSRVVISDAMLKFHANDRRADFRAAWQERCAAMFVKSGL